MAKSDTCTRKYHNKLKAICTYQCNEKNTFRSRLSPRDHVHLSFRASKSANPEEQENTRVGRNQIRTDHLPYHKPPNALLGTSL